jgi:hypothetical protein
MKKDTLIQIRIPTHEKLISSSILTASGWSMSDFIRSCLSDLTDIDSENFKKVAGKNK